jgi:hypothetical protein
MARVDARDLPTFVVRVSAHPVILTRVAQRLVDTTRVP